MRPKLPTLYTKEGRRYVEYHPDLNPYADTCLYRKLKNGKFVLAERAVYADSLSEGVWAITRSRSRVGYLSARAAEEYFDLHKCSNLQSLTIAQIGNLQKFCDQALFDLDVEGCSVCEAFYKRVAYVINQIQAPVDDPSHPLRRSDYAEPSF